MVAVVVWCVWLGRRRVVEDFREALEGSSLGRLTLTTFYLAG